MCPVLELQSVMDAYMHSRFLGQDVERRPFGICDTHVGHGAKHYIVDSGGFQPGIISFSTFPLSRNFFLCYNNL